MIQILEIHLIIRKVSYKYCYLLFHLTQHFVFTHYFVCTHYFVFTHHFVIPAYAGIQ